MAGRVLIVTHVPWEGPHRIAAALERAGLTLDERRPIDGDPLPAQGEHAAAVFMGGPMNVDQVDRYPALLAEREWIRAAHDAGTPLLGVCLGSQLLARALAAQVTPGGRPEIGWAPVAIHADHDPLVRHLAPSAEVLHWHGDVLELPRGAELLASSTQTPVQGFRSKNAWGFLFHAEADLRLAECWLSEPSMRDEAEAALGVDATDRILARAAAIDTSLRERSDPMFEAFAELIAA